MSCFLRIKYYCDVHLNLIMRAFPKTLFTCVQNKPAFAFWKATFSTMLDQLISVPDSSPFACISLLKVDKLQFIKVIIVAFFIKYLPN